MPARIPESILADVRAAIEAGSSVKEVAQAFGVSESTVLNNTRDLRGYTSRADGLLRARRLEDVPPSEEEMPEIETELDLARCLARWQGAQE